MNKINRISTIFILIILAIATSNAFSQSKIPKEKIPTDIPSDVREEIERLYSPVAAERTAGAINLGKMGTRAAPAAPFLISILSDYSPVEMTYMAGEITIKDKTSPSEQASVALKKIGKLALESWIAALKDEHSKIREEAAMALGDLKEISAVEPLIATLKDEDDDVRRHSAISLGKIKDNRAVEYLLEAIRYDDSLGVQIEAAGALGKIKDGRAIKPLITAFKDKDNPMFQEYALKALIEMGRLAVEPLIFELKNDDWEIRRDAAEALGEIKNTRATKPLIDALKDKNEVVRWKAVEALGKTKDTQAVEPLIAALKDEDSYVRNYAAKALWEITKQDLGKEYNAWLKWWEENKDKFLKKNNI